MADVPLRPFIALTPRIPTCACGQPLFALDPDHAQNGSYPMLKDAVAEVCQRCDGPDLSGDLSFPPYEWLQ